MANHCNYSMRIQGNPDSVENVIKALQSDYHYETMEFDHDKHLFRVFEALIVDDDIDEEDDYRSVIVDGYCAWSVNSCMMEDGYYFDNKKEYGDKSKGTTLVELSKDNNVQIEVYSEEGGACFQEHILIVDGEIVINDCVDYFEIEKEQFEDDEMTLERFLEENEMTMADVVDNDSYYAIGGFKDWDFD